MVLFLADKIVVKSTSELQKQLIFGLLCSKVQNIPVSERLLRTVKVWKTDYTSLPQDSTRSSVRSNLLCTTNQQNTALDVNFGTLPKPELLNCFILEFFNFVSNARRPIEMWHHRPYYSPHEYQTFFLIRQFNNHVLNCCKILQ